VVQLLLMFMFWRVYVSIGSTVVELHMFWGVEVSSVEFEAVIVLPKIRNYGNYHYGNYVFNAPRR